MDPLPAQRIRKRQVSGIPIVRELRKIADEIVLNIPDLISKTELFQQIEQKIISVFGLHNFIKIISIDKISVHINF